MMATLTTVRWYVTMILICISLTIKQSWVSFHVPVGHETTLSSQIPKCFRNLTRASCILYGLKSPFSDITRMVNLGFGVWSHWAPLPLILSSKPEIKVSVARTLTGGKVLRVMREEVIVCLFWLSWSPEQKSEFNNDLLGALTQVFVLICWVTGNFNLFTCTCECEITLGSKVIDSGKSHPKYWLSEVYIWHSRDKIGHCASYPDHGFRLRLQSYSSWPQDPINSLIPAAPHTHPFSP